MTSLLFEVQGMRMNAGVFLSEDLDELIVMSFWKAIDVSGYLPNIVL